jgi:hypothetical protein
VSGTLRTTISMGLSPEGPDLRLRGPFKRGNFRQGSFPPFLVKCWHVELVSYPQ